MRSEIWLVNLGDNKGSVQGGIRPVIVISNNVCNTHSPVIHIVPITSRTKNKLPTHVTIDASTGLKTESTALTEQSTLISKDVRL